MKESNGGTCYSRIIKASPIFVVRISEEEIKLV